MKRILFGFTAFVMAASPTASYAQFQVSHPSIRYEEWHYEYGQLVGHFMEFCDGGYQWWGHLGPENYYANGDCEGY